MEGVAAAAGTTVPSLRRRYRSKAELAAAVIDSLRVEELPAALGEPRELALAVLENFQRNLRRPRAMAILGSLLAEEHREPGLLSRFRRRLVRPRRALLRRALAEGVDAGDLPPGLDVDGAANLLIGSFYGRYISGDPIPRDWARRVLLIVWPPAPRHKQ
jgi:AcrR family transcriptional regulator